MQSHLLLADLQRATYIAWVVTTIFGVLSGFVLRLIFRTIAQRTRMRLASATVAAVLGLFVFAGLQVLRYRIEEAPFESRVWIHPSSVSLYLPAVAIVLGVALPATFTKQVAVR